MNSRSFWGPIHWRPCGRGAKKTVSQTLCDCLYWKHLGNLITGLCPCTELCSSDLLTRRPPTFREGRMGRQRELLQGRPSHRRSVWERPSSPRRLLDFPLPVSAEWPQDLVRGLAGLSSPRSHRQSCRQGSCVSSGTTRVPGTVAPAPAGRPQPRPAFPASDPEARSLATGASASLLVVCASFSAILPTPIFQRRTRTPCGQLATRGITGADRPQPPGPGLCAAQSPALQAQRSPAPRLTRIHPALAR